MNQPSDNTRSANGTYGLPREYVCSNEVFDRETEAIFSTQWLCVARVSELKNGLLPIEFEKHKIVIAQSKSSDVKAFRNFCRHRGSQLVTESNCEQLGQRIQCPYHAWTYDRNGKLVSAPNMDGVDGFDASEFGLLEIECEVLAGFVWVNFAPKESLERFLQPLNSQLAEWSVGELEVVETIEYQVNANWKLIFQNYNECYHCPSVHPVLNSLTPYKNASNDIEAGPILGGPMQLSDESETMAMDGRAVAKRLPKLNDEQVRTVNYFTIFPTIFLSTHPDYVLVHRIERVSINKTKIVCQFLFHPESAAQSCFDPSSAVEFWDMTNRQDWTVCELAQSGMEDIGYTPGPYSNLESVVAAFDRHYLNALST